MENQQEQPIQKTEEKIETNNKASVDIEPIEKIQPSYKSNSGYERKKNFHQIGGKSYYHNYHQGHNNNYTGYPNPNTMGKNRTNSEKYSHSRYQERNYGKNNHNDQRSKIYKYNTKKRNQDIMHINDNNHQRNNDEKLDFINPYVEAENFENYNEFAKLPNLNFLKQNSKQKRFPEEEEKDNNKNVSGQNNAFINFQNQNMLFNQIQMNILQNLKMNNVKSIPNNYLQNNTKNNTKSNNNNILLNNQFFPMNLNNNHGLPNLNNAKLPGIAGMNNPINNLNNNLMLLNQINQLKNFNFSQQQQNVNNKMPLQIPNNQQLDKNINISNNSPSKINQMKNQNPLNDNLYKMNILNTFSSEKINAMNSLIQAYFKTLQYMKIILNKMTQLFSSSNNNTNLFTDIQTTVNQLINNINTEIAQMSPYSGINESTNTKNNSSENNENKENVNNINENDKSDKYVQNILSSWPEQKFYKPYSPLLKLEKNQMLLKPSNFLNNPFFANPKLNINTMNMPYSNLGNQDSIFNKKEIYTDKKINELKKVGKCVKGILRMNQSLDHGYVTIQGIENDILIKGNNLYECLNLDEVVIELLDFNKWNPMGNKKNRKLPRVNDDSLINDSSKNRIDEDNFRTKEDRFYYINKQLKDFRPEGTVVKIIRSPNKEKQQICTIKCEKNKILAIPLDDTIPNILINIRNVSKKLIDNIDSMENKDCLSYLPMNLEKDYKNYKKKYFLVKIHSFVSTGEFSGPIGYIVDEIGSLGNIDVESNILLKLNNVNYEDNFSDEIMNEVNKKLSEIKITDEYIKSTKRLDFRNELVFTIDPYTSKDLDDAIHVKVIDEKTQLLEIGVHIADPTTYVDVDSLLDQEALNRATTVYLVQKKIPMLPVILSDDVCSIMPGKDTLSISCIFRIYLNNGSLDNSFEPYFTLSVVNSRAKWDYNLVQKIIEKKEVKYDELKFEDGTKPQSEEIFNQLKKSVEILYQLTKLVRKERFDSGSLMIEQEDIEFDLDKETQMPSNFRLTKQNEAHSLIEELMLISNLLCARFIFDNLKKFALLRRHPFFNDKNYGEIHRYFSMNKITNNDFVNMGELNKILKNIKQSNYNEYICVQKKLKFLLLRAEYVFAGKYRQDELIHSSLNYGLYTHFTSPIRRYPDMIVHRQLKEIFKYLKTKPEKFAFKKFEKYMPYIDHINKRYNSARIISLKSKRLFQCLYLKNAPKKKYTALIMDIISTSDNNNKKGVNSNQSYNMLNNRNYNSNNNEEEDEVYLMLFVPELNLELEWRKSDNEEIVVYQYNQEKNEIYIDYKNGEEGIKNKYLKNFDSLQVDLFSVDSVPIDAKCKIDFSK